MLNKTSSGLRSIPFAALTVALLATPAHGQATCGSSVGPDVIVGDLIGWSKFGTVGTISGYAFGTTSCNMGNAVLQWTANSNQHPVIAMNAYRLKGGRFEQIGMSWVKHGWGASALNACCTCINPNNFEQLGIGCSDPYDSGTNGNQTGFINNGHWVTGLGPRSEINAFNGAFSWPYGTQTQGGDAIYKRVQIQMSDLDPAQNAGALYFAEAEYITPHDAAVGNNFNNNGYRQFFVGALTSGSYTLSFGVPTIHRQEAAIQAWAANDPTVMLVNANVPGEGRFIIGSRVSNNGDGTWHYEYAVYNMNSDRSGHDFTVTSPPGVTITNVGFHDVPYHSGEPYDGTDWPRVPTPASVQWSTTDFAINPNANALRWDTLYNFRFDANTPPRNGDLVLGLFKPGSPTSLMVNGRTPSRLGDADGNNVVDVNDLLAVITQWGPCPAPPAPCTGDLNGDGQDNINDLLLVISNWG